MLGSPGPPAARGPVGILTDARLTVQRRTQRLQMSRRAAAPQREREAGQLGSVGLSGAAFDQGVDKAFRIRTVRAPRVGA